jgi:hypothetical protein
MEDAGTLPEKDPPKNLRQNACGEKAPEFLHP